MTRIGVLGAGQLGRMLALAGYSLGLQFRFLDPAPGAPAGQLAEQVVGDYDDPEALEHFAQGLDVCTYEFENVPLQAAAALAQLMPLHPGSQALSVAQDRLHEKIAFARHGIGTAQYREVNSGDDLQSAVSEIGLPSILKTRRLGYDGKGQFTLREGADLERAWQVLGVEGNQTAELILEGVVPFSRELSLIAVRGARGEMLCYPLVENRHREGILRLSIAPAPDVAWHTQQKAEGFAARLLDALDYRGVAAIELFQVGDDLLANEMAPRVHNSGHWSIEGAHASQFENHLRAIMGMPLGSTQVPCHAAMLNIIGELPNREGMREILSTMGAHLHLYGKSPRPGRKLGHVTLLADEHEALMSGVQKLIPLVSPGLSLVTSDR